MYSDRADPPQVLVGASSRSRRLLRLIEKLGHSHSPVLILGETGTGKELVAREIHNVDPTGSLVPIDCSALVGPLMESELFGHTKGAFTGAVAAKGGLLEAADGGTAFLDEVGELPLDLQAKLLRVLQEKEVRPVGSLIRRRANFRLIAATNRDLSLEVERGSFRRDLFYRLNVVTLRLSPLRDRKEDIPVLIESFLSRYGRNHSLTNEAMDALLCYQWPGNVRELENCIQRMVAINTGPLLHSEDLPTAVLNDLRARKANCLTMAAVAAQGDLNASVPFGGPISPEVSGDGSDVMPLTEVEKRAILRTLEYTKGDRVMAAHLLGIGRTTLYRKLKEYRLST